MIRDGGELRPVSWERALDEAAAALEARQRAASARSPAARRTNEEGFLLQRLLREGLGSPDLDSRAGGDAAARRCTARWRAPGAAGDGAPTSSSPTPCSCSTASPSTTCRSSTCASARACAATASSSPWPRAARRRSTPTPSAGVRFAPGAGEALRSLALSAALRPGPARRRPSASPQAAGVDADARARAGARCCERRRGRRRPLRRAPGLGPARRRRRRARCSTSPARLGLGGRDGAGLLVRARRRQRPRPARGRRAAQRRPGLRRAAPPAATPPQIAAAARRGRADRAVPAARRPGRRPARPRRRGSAALERATDRHRPRRLPHRRRRASTPTVVFPAEAYAEKDGTITHPDGRLQRLRPAIGHPGDGARRSGRCIAELAPARRPRPRRPHRRRWRPRQLFEAVPFYAGPDARRDRRPGRALAGARRRRGLPAPPSSSPLDARGRRRAAAPRAPTARLRLGTFRSIWAAPEVARLARAAVPAPATSASSSRPPTPSASARQGDRVDVGSDGHDASTRRSPLRAAAPAGTRLPRTGTRDSPTPRRGPLVEVRRAMTEPVARRRSATTSRGGSRSSRRS